MRNSIEKEKLVELEAIEKQFFYLTEKNRARARKKYFALLHSCQRNLLDEPIYIDRI